MEIGKKLKEARNHSELTQEEVAEKLNVTRQTISNWENERSYPDIINVIELSTLYSISLDDLLKGDQAMIEYLEENTNVVKSNRKLITAIAINIVFILLLFVFPLFIPFNKFYMIGIFCFAIVSFTALLYQIIKKL